VRPRAQRTRFGAVMLWVKGRRVAASVSIVIAWASWPSIRKGILMGIRW